MSDESIESQIGEKKTAWIYLLNKEQLARWLFRRTGTEWDAQETSIETLRKELRRAVRTEGSTTDEKEEEPQVNAQPAADEQRDMASFLNSLEQFERKKDDIEEYLERLDLYLVAANITENKQKAAILLTKLGPDIYSAIRAECGAPEEIKTKTYEQITAIIREKIFPPTSHINERSKFRKIKQALTQEVSEFATLIRKEAAKCKFANAEEACLDQFINGLANEETRFEVLKAKPTTFAGARTIAIDTEEARVNAKSGVRDEDKEEKLLKMGRFMQPTGFQRREPRRGRGGSSNVRGAASGTRQFGIQDRNSCYCCGLRGHFARECRFNKSNCENCGRQGHMKQVCRSGPSTSTPRQQNFLAQDYEDQQNENDGEDSGSDDNNRASYVFESFHMLKAEGNKKASVLTATVEQHALEIEVDTGAYYTVIPESEQKKLFPECELVATNVCMKFYDNTLFRPIGKLQNVRVELDSDVRYLDIYVTKYGYGLLMGKQWLEAFERWPPVFPKQERGKMTRHNTMSEKKDVSGLQALLKKRQAVFSPTLGTFKFGELKLQLIPGAQPIYKKARPLPLALKDKVQQEIGSLTKAGVVTPIKFSDWATPIVPIMKANGGVRLCGDFKVTVNRVLQIDRYPLPRIEELLATLHGGITFTKLDLSRAYAQIPLESESRKIVTINTHIGLFQYNRLPYGVSTGPGSFQRLMEQVIGGMSGVGFFLDDILITGATEHEHVKRLEQVLERLEASGLTLERSKCEFFKPQLTYLGYKIDRQGIHTTEDKVNAVVKAPPPKNFTELRAFLGLVNFYARFLNNLATTLEPLHEQLRRKTFEWNEQCIRAFEAVKKAVVTAPILVHYNPNLPLVVTADASAVGMAAVLAHRVEPNVEKPIAFKSRTLTMSERAWAPIDREAGAIIFAVTQFYIYVYGRHFTLKTDHKPLTHIFGPEKPIPIIAASRLQRWAFFLSAFTYTIAYITSKQNGIADALSRLPLETEKGNPAPEPEAIKYVKYMQSNEITIDWKTIRDESRKDRVLRKVILYTQIGWPNDKTKIEPEEKTFRTRKDELHVINECLLWGYRVIVPVTLRPAILQEIHSSHMGMTRMKSLARSYVWWPNMDEDIEIVSKACEACCEIRDNPPKSISQAWPWPVKPWERLHADFAGPLFNNMYLIVTDAHSKWVEIWILKKTDAERTIQCFVEAFTRFGLPKQIHTDNGTQFTSEIFKKFVKQNGIRHTLSPPYHPESNGLAENTVKTFKRSLKRSVQAGNTVSDAVTKFLQQYRATPHSTTGVSPASLMLQHEFRTKLDLLKVSVEDRVEKKVEKQVEQRGGKKPETFEKNEKILVKDYRVNPPRWAKAVIHERVSAVIYLVVVEGLIWKRHVDQIVRAGNKTTNETNKKEREEKSQVAVPTLRRSERLRRKDSERK